MNTKVNAHFLGRSLAVAAIALMWSTGAAAKDDWEYWDKQCAPKCATAGPDGKPDGGCMENVMTTSAGHLTLARRQSGVHVPNAKLTTLLRESKQLSIKAAGPDRAIRAGASAVPGANVKK